MTKQRLSKRYNFTLPDYANKMMEELIQKDIETKSGNVYTSKSNVVLRAITKMYKEELCN